MSREFPATEFQRFVGKTVVEIENDPDCDEGLRITFSDGSSLIFGFSGCEGSICYELPTLL